MKKTELIIGYLMRIGLFFSLGIILVGGIFYLFQQGTDVMHATQFRGEPAGLTSLYGVWHHMLVLSPLAIIQFGILILVLTQILRVAFTAFYFMELRDYFFTWISLFIFTVLTISFFWN